MQGLADYSAAQKVNWRGWAYNTIVAHLVGKRHAKRKRSELGRKTLLYLIGPEDKDRPEALKRGFANNNVIGVDDDRENVERVRRAGGLAICGKLETVLHAWPADWPVDVVAADLCCGQTKTAVAVAVAFVAMCRKEPGVLLLNLQHGRDALSSGLRRHVPGSAWEGNHNHRAYFLLANLLYLTTTVRLERPGLNDMDRRVLADGEYRKLHGKALWAIHSYRGGRVTMDSAVVRWPMWLQYHRDQPRNRSTLEGQTWLCNYLAGRLCAYYEAHNYCRDDLLDNKQLQQEAWIDYNSKPLFLASRASTMRRQIAAIRAVRTRRT